MTGSLPLPTPRSVFRDDEPVLQSHSLLDDARPPRFGERICWDLNGVIRKPVNQSPANMRMNFHALSPGWNLTARELTMIWFNPRHPKVLAHGIHLKADPRAPNTVRQRLSILREIAAFGLAQGLGDDPALWDSEAFRRHITHNSDPEPKSGLSEHIVVIKALHRFRQVLACGGPQEDPWPGKSVFQILDQPTTAPLKTPVIKPETWFPLIRAAWTYISVFAPDILRAVDHWQAIQHRGGPIELHAAAQNLSAWLADPRNLVPIRPEGTRAGREGLVNWSLLSWMVGLDPDHRDLFQGHTSTGRARRTAVEEVVSTGRTQVGLLPDLLEVEHLDGTRGPWHDSLHPRQLWFEALALRNACYVFVAALSMMRDSELREILKGSVVEYFSTPAVKSTKVKLDPDLPVKHWWIIQPVAQAIEIAERLSPHEELAFAGVPGSDPGTLFESRGAIEDLVKHVNSRRHLTALDKIPDQHVTPHMFRRTMAMLTRDFPGSEIAVGMQLKHAASRALTNRTTQGYMEQDPAWIKHLDTAVAERKLNRVREMFDADSKGDNIGFGPGADQLREAFAAVRQQAEQLRATGQAQRGDKRVEYDLLRGLRFSIRFGKLNHCTMDDANPVGAKCLEDAVIPEGHRGPLLDRCRPSRCGNSIIAPAHLPIWRAEQTSLTRLLETPKLPTARKAALTQQLQEVEHALRKADRA
ncbi:hypothetical protein [Streptomyces albidoflavus]|uniref:hypothetical protein n=1 Tax=Streptomyces albidoflavus TaxID=1886 RepID=UPI0033ADE059